VLETVTAASPFAFACPNCRALLDTSQDAARCSACAATFTREAGIWRFLSEERSAAFAQFEHEYHTVRRAEGWGSDDASYYRSLPWRDASGRFADLWRVRATSFRTFVQHVLPHQRSLRILDVGAGNGWLAYQLARRGHAVAAIDFQVDPRDGLGAWRHYDVTFTPIQAEFDVLPLAADQADVVVFNGSLHYSTNCETTLREALRVLRPNGAVAILDSPVYAASRSGMAMVNERQAGFQRVYGFASDALPHEHFLTYVRLAELSQPLGVRWRVIKPFRGWRWALRPYWARLRGRRAPAEFPVIIGSRL
jgi:SAM-dependent methyltransferase